MRVTVTVAAAICEVKPATIRQWVARGHIVRYPDGYDVQEMLHWIDQTRRAAMIRTVACKTPEAC